MDKHDNGAIITIKATKAEKGAINKAARIEGKTIAEFVLSILRKHPAVADLIKKYESRT